MGHDEVTRSRGDADRRRYPVAVLGVLAASVLAWPVDAVAAGQAQAAESLQVTGPSGPSNPRDLEVARPFGGRHRDLVGRALDGSIDIHMHTHPDAAERPVDAFEAARIATSYGLRAIVLKSHYEPTAAQAYLVRQVVPGIEVFGGITMDLANGGVNPAAVEHMSQVLGGFGRIVWMPTYDADAAVRSSSQDDRPFAAVSRNGELLPESQEVLALVARHDLVLATGHVSPDEGLLLVREARDAGVQHILVTHALDTGWTVPQMQEAAEAGAFIEFAKPLGRLPIEQYVDTVRQVGPRVCIVSQAGVSHLPPELVGAFVVALVEHGFTEHELDLMMKHNPARLLGLPTP